MPQHGDKPFEIVGVLKRTGTPVDRTVHIGLKALEAIHLDWQGGAPLPGFSIPAEMVRKFDLSPKAITAVLVGLKVRATVFQVQRAVNEFADEPLLAVLPGVALDQMWQIVGIVEKTLLAVSAMIVLTGLAGMIATVLASLNERRHELAILRSVGAGPRHVFALLGIEGVLLTSTGIVIGYLLLGLVATLAAPLIESRFGLSIHPWSGTRDEVLLSMAVLGTGILACLLPAWRATRLSLADGLTPRL